MNQSLEKAIQNNIDNNLYRDILVEVEYEPIVNKHPEGYLIGLLLGTMLYHNLEKYTWVSFYKEIYPQLNDVDKARLDQYCVDKNWLMPRLPVNGVYMVPTSTHVL